LNPIFESEEPNADAKHKLIRRYEVTDAAVHDSQKLDMSLARARWDSVRLIFCSSLYLSRTAVI